MKFRLIVNGKDVDIVWGDTSSPVVWQFKNGQPSDSWVVVDRHGEIVRHDKEEEMKI